MSSSPAGEELLRMIKAAPAPVKPAPVAPAPAPAPIGKAPAPTGAPQTKAAAELLDMIKVAMPTTAPNSNWFKDYPATFGVPALAVGGGALGALYHLLRKKMDPEYKGSLLGHAALGLGLGGIAGGALLGAAVPEARAAVDPRTTATVAERKGRAGDALKKQVAGEVEELKYDRRGPLRQGIRMVRPLIPTRPGTQDYPADIKENVKEFLTDLPDSVALGGKVAPNDTRIAVGSPPMPAKGNWRQGWEGGKPKEFFTLDAKLDEKFGPLKDSSSWAGSETLGSRSQYDYNNASVGMFSYPQHEAKKPAPLRPSDQTLTISGHGSGNPLASVAGVDYVDILRDLKNTGHTKGVNNLILQTCNAKGCDIPNDVVRAALGKDVPRRITYTPPEAAGSSSIENQHRRFIQEPGADRTRLMDPELFAPRRITTVDYGDGAGWKEEPLASQTRVAPLIPTKATRWFADQADRFGTPILKHFTRDPAALGRAIRGATKIHDYATDSTSTQLDSGKPATWDRAKTLIPALKGKVPSTWFDDRE